MAVGRSQDSFRRRASRSCRTSSGRGHARCADDPPPEAPPVADPSPRWASRGSPRRARALKANVGRYARTPSFLELYGNGMGRLLGNPALRPEWGTNADSPSDRSRGRCASPAVRPLLAWLTISTAGSPRRGGRHAPATWPRPASWARSRSCGFSWARAPDRRSGDLPARARRQRQPGDPRGQLPFRPRWLAYLRPELVHVPLPAALELAAYADADVRVRQSYADSGNLVDHARRLIIGCGVSLAWPRAHMRLTGSAANLTDTRQEDVDAWSLPGRAVFVALAYAPVGGDGGGAAIFDPRYAQ